MASNLKDTSKNTGEIKVVLLVKSFPKRFTASFSLLASNAFLKS